MSGFISQPTHAVNRHLASCRCGGDSSMSRAQEPHQRLARAESPGLLARNTVDNRFTQPSVTREPSATTLLHTFLPRPDWPGWNRRGRSKSEVPDSLCLKGPLKRPCLVHEAMDCIVRHSATAHPRPSSNSHISVILRRALMSSCPPDILTEAAGVELHWLALPPEAYCKGGSVPDTVGQTTHTQATRIQAADPESVEHQNQGDVIGSVLSSMAVSLPCHNGKHHHSWLMTHRQEAAPHRRPSWRSEQYVLIVVAWPLPIESALLPNASWSPHLTVRVETKLAQVQSVDHEGKVLLTLLL